MGKYRKLVIRTVLLALLQRKGTTYIVHGKVSHIIGNIAICFILVDKYVILNAVEELITKENMQIFKCEI
jgi:hypothetical protein